MDVSTDGSDPVTTNMTISRKPTKDKSIPDFPAEQGQVTVLHDLIAGGVAGSSSVIVGHPFDTIKVRMQMGTGGSGIYSTITQFGGVSSLFRGLSAPLSAAAAINAVIFSSYGWSSRIWDSYATNAIEQQQQQLSQDITSSNNNKMNANDLSLSLEEENASVHDPWQKAFVCGSFAGLVQCFLICPMEHVKCRIQVQHGKGCADNVYSGPAQATKRIIQDHGISGLYRGWWCTFWREVPAFGLYFSVYDYLKDRTNTLLAEMASGGSSSTLATNNVQDAAFPHHHHTWLASAIAGGFSGAATWLVVYPFDVLKTRIQTADMTTPSHKLKMWNVGRSIVAKHGWKHLFRGMSITLLRAFPTNALIFPVYEFTLLHISGGFDIND
mmetsp:Transcript_19928/g.28215  ORF Transcript_19928/g.28215 Transcript_19928/m.28215 type:complete len:383 (-) Transcript_19928:503-1651(-)